MVWNANASRTPGQGSAGAVRERRSPAGAAAHGIPRKTPISPRSARPTFHPPSRRVDAEPPAHGRAARTRSRAPRVAWNRSANRGPELIAEVAARPGVTAERRPSPSRSRPAVSRAPVEGLLPRRARPQRRPLLRLAYGQSFEHGRNRSSRTACRRRISRLRQTSAIVPCGGDDRIRTAAIAPSVVPRNSDGPFPDASALVKGR